MPVPTLITDLSVTLANNSPAGTDVIGTSLDDYIRSSAGFIAQLYAGKKAYASVSTTYTLLATDGLVECDATAGAFTVTLTAAASSLGRIVTIKKIDSSANAITIEGNASETIDGALNQSLASQYQSITLHCDGTGWNVVADTGTAAQGTDSARNASTAFVMNEFGKHKNYVINGNFDVWQRGTAAVTSALGLSADRWRHMYFGDSYSATQGTFVSGDALYDPTAGNTAAANYLTISVTSVAQVYNYCWVRQAIEDVRRLAGKTVTVSFWAKAASGTPLIGVNLTQNFGAGGAVSSDVEIAGQSVTLSSTWTKFTKTFTVPSINGKTLGTTADTSSTFLKFWLDAGSDYATQSGTIGQASKTVSIAQVQLEEGSVETQFEYRSKGTEELLCYRYYYRIKADAVNYFFGLGWTGSATIMYVPVVFPVPLIGKPTALEQSGTATDYEVYTASSSTVACSSVPAFNTATKNIGQVTFTVAAGLTAGQAGMGRAATTNGYLAWNVEL